MTTSHFMHSATLGEAPIFYPPNDAPTGDARPKTVTGPVFAVTTLLGGLLVIVGSFLPWVSLATAFYGTITYSGVEGGKDGLITLVIGVLAVAIGAVRLTDRLPRVVQHLVTLLGVLALAISFYDLQAMQEYVAKYSEPYSTAFVGSGLYAVVIGGFLVTIGGLVSQRPR